MTYTLVMKTLLVASVTFFLAMPAWAGNVRASTDDFDVEQPFDEVIGKQFLRSLLNQALDAIEDHIELRGKLRHGEQNGGESGRFELRLYPQGKSRSDEHVGAEGSFRFSPDDDDNELTLRFKSSKDTRRTAQSPGDFL